MIGLHLGIAKRACKLWISWRWGIEDALQRTSSFLRLDIGFDAALLSKWSAIVNTCTEDWARMLGMANALVDEADEDLWEDLEQLVEDLNLV